MLVNEVMNRNVVVVKKDATIKQASEVMAKTRIGSLVVVENNKIKGIITVTDIAVVEPKLIASIASLLSMQFPGYRGG